VSAVRDSRELGPMVAHLSNDARRVRWGAPRATTRTVALIAIAVVACCARAQSDDSFAVDAKDLHEEVVRIDVAVSDLYGREETRRMPITIFRPDGDGPFPLVVFNHGRATPEKRASQGRSRPEALARYLVAKGFVVLAPTRIGYWETYGAFDPEDNGRCTDLRVAHMAQVASDEVLATVAYAKTLPYVDANRWIVAGQSVGGLTAIATVGRHPAGLVGGINFSGGAGGNPDKNPGHPCSPQRVASLYAGVGPTSTVPMVWFYWPNDLFFGEDVPKAWYRAWSQAGGDGSFNTFGPVGADGHNGFNADMDHWVPIVDRFLARLGFTQAVAYERPTATGFAALDDVDHLPSTRPSARAAYGKFLAAASPRAFAIGDHGAFGWATKDYVLGKAIGYCRRSGQACRLYAVDDDVVWTEP
jgi:dienelactone hydrolase